MNIGKWPSATEVYQEWQLIASAFPYLNLTCRLLHHEAGYSERTPGIAVVYEVKEGKVKARYPYKDEIDLVSPDKDQALLIKEVKDKFNSGLSFEHGITLQDWKKVCDHVASIMTSK